MVDERDYWEPLDGSDYDRVEEGDLVDILTQGRVLASLDGGSFVMGWPIHRPHFVQPDPSQGGFFVYPMDNIYGQDIEEGIPSNAEMDRDDPIFVDEARIHKVPDGDEVFGVYLHEEDGQEHALPYKRSDIPDGLEVQPYIPSHDDAQKLEGQSLVARSTDGYVDEMTFTDPDPGNSLYRICHAAGAPCYDWFLPASPNHDDRDRDIIAIRSGDSDASTDPADHILGTDTTTTTTTTTADEPTDFIDMTPPDPEDVSGYPDFTIRADDNAVIRPAIDALGRVIDTAIVAVNSGGLASKAVDAKNVAMTNISIPATNFETYTADEGRFAIDIDALDDALSSINKRDPVAVEGDANAREVTVTDVSSGTVVDTIDMEDPSEARNIPAIPNLEPYATYDLPGDQFSRVIRGAKKLSDHVAIGATPQPPQSRGDTELLFHAEGDIDELLGYPDHEDTTTGGTARETASVYSIGYMDTVRLSIDRPASTDLSITLHDSDTPATFEHTIGDEPGAHVTHFVSPRVTDDSDINTRFDTFASDDDMLEARSFSLDADGDRAKRMFSAFGAYADEYRVVATNTGLETRSTDSSNVGLVDSHAEPDYFDSYTEEGGFPQDPIGLPGHRLEGYLKLWRKNDDFALAHNSETRYISIKHDIFTIKSATINPDSIRSDPDLPGLQQSHEANVGAGALRSAVQSADAISEYITYISDGESVYTATIGDDSTTHEDLYPTDVRGRAFSTISTEYLTTALDAAPTPDDEQVTVRASVENPIIIDTTAGGGTLRATYMIAPRVLADDSTLLTDIRDLLSGADIDVSWLSPGVSADGDIPAFEGAAGTSITERMRERRLSTYPIETKVAWGSGYGDPELLVRDADDMAVPEDTIAAVEQEVRDASPLDVLPTGETIADVTFTSETDYDISYRNVQPDYEYRLATDDGVRMSRLNNTDDHYSYVSDERETPARRNAVAGVRESSDGDGYVLYLTLKEQGEAETTEDTIISAGGYPTIAAAYSDLVDYVESHDIEAILRDAGATIEMSTRALRDELDDITDEYVDYRVEGAPDSATADAPFFASIVGRQNLYPDASYRADITVDKPDDTGGAYPVRYTLSLEANGPGDVRVKRELASETVGEADTRSGIPGLVREAFVRLENIDPVYTRRDAEDTPPRAPGALPSPTVDGVRQWVTAYLPAPKETLRDEMETRDPPLPFLLDDVDGVGPSRAGTLGEAGLEDMLDFVALTGKVGSSPLSTKLDDLPSSARTSLMSAAATIWEDIIWPRRPDPPGFRDGAAGPPPNVQTPTDTSSEPDDAEPSGGDGTDTGDDDIPPGVYEETREDPPYPPERTREAARVLDIPVDLEDVESVGPATAKKLHDVGIRDTVDLANATQPTEAYAISRVLSDIRSNARANLMRVAQRVDNDAILAANDEGYIPQQPEYSTEDDDDGDSVPGYDDAYEIVSPYRPLTRDARRALNEYGIIEETTPGEKQRQSVVYVEEYPGDEVLDQHELVVGGGSSQGNVQEGDDQTSFQELMSVSPERLRDHLDVPYDEVVAEVADTNIPIDPEDITGIGASIASDLQAAGISNTVDLALATHHSGDDAEDRFEELLGKVPPQYEDNVTSTLGDVMTLVDDLESPEPASEETPDGFKDKRMQNAYYWAAQAAGWMEDGPNAGLGGTYYVEVMAGQPIIVLDDSTTQSNIDALTDALYDYDFPEIDSVSEQPNGNTRIFIEPTDDRLQVNYITDWQDWEPHDGFEDTAPPEPDPDPEPEQDDGEDDDEPFYVAGVPSSEVAAAAERVAPGTSAETGQRAGESVIQIQDAAPGSAPEFTGSFPSIIIEGNDLQRALTDVAQAWEEAVDLTQVDTADVNDARREVESEYAIQLPEVSDPVMETDSDDTDVEQSTWAQFQSIISETGEKKERRERDAAELIEDQILNEYPDWFTDAVVGLSFGREGLESIRIGAAVSEQGRDDLAVIDNWDLILAEGDPNNPQGVYDQFTEVVAMLNPDDPMQAELTERLDNIAGLSMFRLQEELVDPYNIFIPADMVRPLAQRVPSDFWQLDMYAHMEDLSAAYRAAQEVHECATGSDALCSVIEDSIAGDLQKYSMPWLRSQAYRQHLDGDFDPAEFFAYYHDTRDAGGRRDQPAFPVSGTPPQEQPDTSTTTDPDPDPEPEPEDVAEGVDVEAWDDAKSDLKSALVALRSVAERAQEERRSGTADITDRALELAEEAEEVATSLRRDVRDVRAGDATQSQLEEVIEATERLRSIEADLRDKLGDGATGGPTEADMVDAINDAIDAGRDAQDAAEEARERAERLFEDGILDPYDSIDSVPMYEKVGELAGVLDVDIREAKNLPTEDAFENQTTEIQNRAEELQDTVSEFNDLLDRAEEKADEPDRTRQQDVPGVPFDTAHDIALDADEGDTVTVEYLKSTTLNRDYEYERREASGEVTRATTTVTGGGQRQFTLAFRDGATQYYIRSAEGGADDVFLSKGQLKGRAQSQLGRVVDISHTPDTTTTTDTQTTTVDPFEPAGRETYNVFISEGAVPEVYVSPNESGTPRQSEGEGIADRIALQVRSETDVSDQPRDTPIGTATVDGQNVVEVDMTAEGGATTAPSEPEPEPEPQETVTPSDTATPEPDTPEGRLDRAFEEVTVEELNIDSADIENVTVEDLNVDGSNITADDIRDRQS